jgi:hypothetical protein
MVACGVQQRGRLICAAPLMLAALWRAAAVTHVSSQLQADFCLRLCCCLALLQVTVAERAAAEPPRLGKHRFEAPPVAVLTSDEVTGSLRQIKVRDLAHDVGEVAGAELCAAHWLVAHGWHSQAEDKVC